MKKIQVYLLTAISVVSLWFSSLVSAAPWVDVSDIYLRADIQALADEGVITVPINTYPLMWAGIGADLSKVEPSTLSPALTEAFARVNFYYQNALTNRGNTGIKLAGATDAARFQHFGSDYRERGELKASHEYMGDRFAFKISGSGNFDAEDDQSFRLDDSYVAMALGNWMVTLGSVEQWWGPGFDTGLIKSNNARPAPSLMISRNNAAAFETPWLSWIGPWTFTAGVTWLNDDDRAVENPLLWNFRGTIRPIQQIEIGLSWTTMFCGDGQECGFTTLLDAFAGKSICPDGSTNCDPALKSAVGNQMAGFDIRYGDTWFDIPVGIYLERTCEDSKGPMPWELADCGYLVGTDTRLDFDSQQYKLFFEYSNTTVACGLDPNSFNCFYEHGTYQSGSRYYGRSYGSTYDSDAKVYALGVVGQFANSRGFTSILRYAQLNNDGVNRGGLWSPQPPKEDLLMLELSYRMPIWKGMMSVGGTVSQSEFETADNDTDGTLFGTYEYRF
ncbi:capsule assembly Wzi family protein [Shewanella sp. Isolate11]|uniref:capsule assembly Wzi family protein n=1 Tax=Shewanella sp. Isolate11 TaxID=2908530 RepID=UPI001EFE11BD|nr:capsule assembly Wzi family protein [Shewanella sp. Isolate11]MCG9697971.1 capsule assembly Wzi family protein [Shewanella sp. Isolate11]